LADEPIIRLILDGTVVRVRLDKKATSISILVSNGIEKGPWIGTEKGPLGCTDVSDRAAELVGVAQSGGRGVG
jgi:hypothetical protein